ncbi:MAG: ABC transporter permease subunit [Chitinispirillaceae bacterium]|jgi:ABC-2 type transport system permease protein
MQKTIAIFKKEFKSYFISPIAYVFITVFLAVSSYLFFHVFFLNNQADMRGFFDPLPIIFLFFIPAIAMRSWAEERKVRTLELLLTWPVSDLEVVSGKFLASFCFIAVAILLTVTIPVSILLIGGKPDLGPIITGYIGTLLMGGAYLAIGMWISSYTENQIIAFLLGVVACFFFYMIGSPFIVMFAAPLVATLFTYLGLGNHFDSIQRGVIDSRDIVYYFSIIGFFLFMNIQSLAGRKWE